MKEIKKLAPILVGILGLPIAMIYVSCCTSGSLALWPIIVVGGLVSLMSIVALSFYVGEHAGKAVTNNSIDERDKLKKEIVSALTATLVLVGMGLWFDKELAKTFLFLAAIVVFMLGVMRFYAFLSLRNNGDWPLSSDKEQSAIATALLIGAVFAYIMLVS